MVKISILGLRGAGGLQTRADGVRQERQSPHLQNEGRNSGCFMELPGESDDLIHRPRTLAHGRFSQAPSRWHSYIHTVTSIFVH